MMMGGFAAQGVWENGGENWEREPVDVEKRITYPIMMGGLAAGGLRARRKVDWRMNTRIPS